MTLQDSKLSREAELGFIAAWVDLPPLWLLGAAAAGLGLSAALPLAPGWSAPNLGLALLLAAGVLAVWALITLRRARTTVLPRRAPTALVTDGAFKISRHPIYLADVLILLGLAFLFGSLWLLAITPIFAWIITRRFIQPEEAALAQRFGPDYEAWRLRSRMWI